MELLPYIIFNGNCEEALNFYAKALKGEVLNLQRFQGSPAEGMSPANPDQVLHAHFKADGVFFMASDNGSGPAAPAGGMVHLSLDFGSAEELDAAFAALSEGANVSMPVQDTFWGARFGMLTDRFGLNWMFNYDKPGAKPNE